MYISTKAREWAKELFEVGATLDQAEAELKNAFVDPNSELGCEVIAEFTGMVLDNTEWKQFDIQR